MGIAELRRSVESPGGGETRTVPLLERNDRQRSQAQRLSGIDTEARPFNKRSWRKASLRGLVLASYLLDLKALKAFQTLKAFEGSAEPSHGLCDKAVESYTKNSLIRIEWKD